MDGDAEAERGAEVAWLARVHLYGGRDYFERDPRGARGLDDGDDDDAPAVAPLAHETGGRHAPWVPSAGPPVAPGEVVLLRFGDGTGALHTYDAATGRFTRYRARTLQVRQEAAPRAAPGEVVRLRFGDGTGALHVYDAMMDRFMRHYTRMLFAPSPPAGRPPAARGPRAARKTRPIGWSPASSSSTAK